jgi:hypothetical protein
VSGYDRDLDYIPQFPHYRPTPEPMTPRQAAALAALKTWRQKGLASRSITQSDLKWFDWRVDYLAAQRELWDAADALLAAEGGTG